MDRQILLNINCVLSQEHKNLNVCFIQTLSILFLLNELIISPQQRIQNVAVVLTMVWQILQTIYRKYTFSVYSYKDMYINLLDPNQYAIYIFIHNNPKGEVNSTKQLLFNYLNAIEMNQQLN